MTPTDSIDCSRCGASLAPDAPVAGLCPRCLLQGAIETDPHGSDVAPGKLPASSGDGTLMPGLRLGHYEIVGPIGSGGMGAVYAARDLELGREVALKVISPAIVGDPGALSRLRREARALAALRHPGVVTVYSVEEASGVHFLTMERLRGETLNRLVSAGGLPWARFLPIALALARAVGAAHARGIVHRDLKPANAMLTDDGEIKVLDFGLAKPAGLAPAELTTATMTEEGRLIGTVPYMSPEQLLGKSVNARSDVFSLGIVLYELVVGEHPFRAESAAEYISAILRDAPGRLDERRRDLPRGVDGIVARCLEKDPARRYVDANALAQELSTLASGDAPAPQRPADGRKMARQIGLAAVVVAAVAIAGVSTLRRGGGGGAADAASASGRVEGGTVSATVAGHPVPGFSAPGPDTQGRSTEPPANDAREEIEPASVPERRALEVGAERAAATVPAGNEPATNDPELAPTVAARLFRESGGRAFALSPGARVSAGDELFLSLRATDDLYLYVLDEDEQGEIYVLFPLAGSELRNPLAGGTTHRVPGTRAGSELNWQVSSAGGREHLILIASRGRLVELERSLAALAEAGEANAGARRLPPTALATLRGIGGLIESAGVAPTAESQEPHRLSRLVSELTEVESMDKLWIRKIELDNPER